VVTFVHARVIGLVVASVHCFQ